MHRDPGIVGAALARDDVIVQIIVDGIHLAPETTSLVWRAAAGRVALVTDAVAAANGGDESYSLGSVELSIGDGAVRGPDGILAGSVLTMIDAVRNLHALGAPLELALEAASTVPAAGPRPARRRQPRRRAAARTSSCSTTTSRSRRCSWEARRVSLPEPAPLHVPGALFLAEIHEQPRALLRLLEHDDEYRARRRRRARARTSRALRRARLVRQRRDVRRLRVRPARAVDRDARLDRAERLLRRRAARCRARRSWRSRSPDARRTSSSTSAGRARAARSPSP